MCRRFRSRHKVSAGRLKAVSLERARRCGKMHWAAKGMMVRRMFLLVASVVWVMTMWQAFADWL